MAIEVPTPPSKDQLYLCIDAGGTKTIAAIADASGTIVSTEHGGAANMAELGAEIAATEVIGAVVCAVRQLTSSGTSAADNVDHEDWVCPIGFERARCGMSGCDTPADAELMTARLRRSIQGITVFNDALLLSSPLTRHSESSWAVAMVAGTGSIVLGISSSNPRTPPPEAELDSLSPLNATPADARPVASSSKSSGTTPHAFAKRGGHGFLFGDKGSGYHLGLTAIQMAADDFDLGLETEGGLAGELRRYFEVPFSSELPGKAHDLDPRIQDPIQASNERKLKIARLSPLILSLVSKGDVLAQRALKACTRAAAEDIAIVVSRAVKLGLSLDDRGGLILSGGLGVQDMFVEALRRALKEVDVEFDWIERVVKAAEDGAEALALADKTKKFSRCTS